MPDVQTQLPVLGLFQDEAGLRDYVAAHLGDLEPGLKLLSTEYVLENDTGAGGRLDILAQDPFGHVVVIEIKRSDQSARSALNELAKYISLLVRDARIPRETIRCMVLSTHWAELQLPLSFFAAGAGLSVEGRLVVREGDGVAYQAVDLTPISDLPQFSPEIELYQYATEADRETHLAAIRRRSTGLPFVKLAMVVLDALPCIDNTPFRSIACLWRIRAEDEPQLERCTGHPVGWLWPYAYPGWEAECDALSWLCSEESETTLFETADALRGTPEKVQNLLAQYALVQVERLGAWPATDLVNTDARIVEQLAAVSRLVSDARPNRCSFQQFANPKFVASWRRAIEGFLKFIAFEPPWRAAAEPFLAALAGEDAKVILNAFDKNHFLFALHQARIHPDTQISHFEIAVEWPDGRHTGLIGHYAWSGQAPVRDADTAAVRTFGSTAWAVLAAFSAVDTNRYDSALTDHGFEPVVFDLAVDTAGVVSSTAIVSPSRDAGRLADFAVAHPAFVNAVAALFEGVPTSPRPEQK